MIPHNGFFRVRFRWSQRIAQSLKELEREEEEDAPFEDIDHPNDIDFEPEHIEVNDDDSASEDGMDPPEEGDQDDYMEVGLGDLRFYIGKDGESL